MGTASLVGDILEWRSPSGPRETGDADREWARVEDAFAATRRDLVEAVVRLEREVGSGVADVFRAHEMMLDAFLSSGDLAAELHGSDLDATGAVRS